MNRALRAVAVVAVVLLATTALVACGGTPSGPTGEVTGPHPLAKFDEQGISFNYPGNWREFHHEVMSSFSSSIADLATVDVPEPCVTTQNAVGSETVCADRFQLGLDTIVVHVTADGFPGWDVVTSRPPNARMMQVGGRRAFVEEAAAVDRPVGADAVVTWTIERPAVKWNSYTIQAIVRGPDLAPIRDQLQRLIESVRFHDA